MRRILAPQVAAGYVRVSSKMQLDGYSPELQEEAIRAWCDRENIKLVLLENDTEKGRLTTRRGYQRILEAVRAGAVDTVVLYMYDRWGPDAGEWITRGNELERLGVDLVSVQEGRDSDPITHGIRGLMAEKNSRDLARRTRPARERAARGGTHCGRTPYGYMRLYPQQAAAHGRLPVAQLVPDADTAPTFRRLFARYADGPGLTLRQLAVWANAQPDLAPPVQAAAWSVYTLRYVLRNPVYVGDIAYNRRPQGQYEWAADDDAFVVHGRHEPLISAETWQAVQARLDGFAGPRTRRGRNGATPLAAGFLVCSQCGGKMSRTRRKPTRGQKPNYYCLGHKEGTNPCPGETITLPVAHAALLQQVNRLRWHRWDRPAVAQFAGEGEQDEAKAALVKRLAKLRVLVADHARQAAHLDLDDDEILEAHREMGKRLYSQLQAVEQQVAAAGGEGGANIAELEKLHGRLRTLAMDLERAAIAGDDEGLRKLVAPLVRSARIVQRVPETRTTWARAAVEWTDDVALLLKADVLAQGDDVVAPDFAAEQAERRRARQQRYYARKRAATAVYAPSTP
jgi:DNA invertase Pin-like site-specific DNA recombinase